MARLGKGYYCSAVMVRRGEEKKTTQGQAKKHDVGIRVGGRGGGGGAGPGRFPQGHPMPPFGLASHWLPVSGCAWSG